MEFQRMDEHIKLTVDYKRSLCSKYCRGLRLQQPFMLACANRSVSS